MSRKNTKGTILAIDMGNTNIVIGCVDDDKVIFEERLSTDLSKTELEYAISFKNVLEIYNIKSEDINGAIISSVVPQLVNVIKAAVEKVVDIEPLVVGPGVKTGLNILMDQPKQVGSDLIVDAVAATHDYGAPVIIVDIGTATTISAVDENGNYIGGAILPGAGVFAISALSLPVCAWTCCQQSHNRQSRSLLWRQAGYSARLPGKWLWMICRFS